MNFAKIVQADLDSPCQELSNGGLWIIVHSPYGFFFGNWFLCVYTRVPSLLYDQWPKYIVKKTRGALQVSEQVFGKLRTNFRQVLEQVLEQVFKQSFVNEYSLFNKVKTYFWRVLNMFVKKLPNKDFWPKDGIVSLFAEKLGYPSTYNTAQVQCVLCVACE